MAFERTISNRVVLGKDLNPHGTFLACRAAEWFIEAAYSAVASLVKGKNLVCVKIHNIDFLKPVYNGDILNFESVVVSAGKYTLDIYVSAHEQDSPSEPCISGFITYCNVNEHTQPVAHGITVEPANAAEKTLQDRIEKMKKAEIQ